MSEDCRPLTSIILEGVRDSGCSLGDEIFISFNDRVRYRYTISGIGMREDASVVIQLKHEVEGP